MLHTSVISAIEGRRREGGGSSVKSFNEPNWWKLYFDICFQHHPGLRQWCSTCLKASIQKWHRSICLGFTGQSKPLERTLPIAQKDERIGIFWISLMTSIGVKPALVGGWESRGFGGGVRDLSFSGPCFYLEGWVSVCVQKGHGRNPWFYYDLEGAGVNT